jgi:hypothetical protein
MDRKITLSQSLIDQINKAIASGKLSMVADGVTDLGDRYDLLINVKDGKLEFTNAHTGKVFEIANIDKIKL